MKTCKTCGADLPEAAFYPNRASCKTCVYAKTAEWRETRRAQIGANDKLSYALRMGRVSKPDACEGCGAREKLRPRHRDFGRPLDARWLCRACREAA